MKNTELNAIVQSQEYDFLRTNKHLGKNILFLTLSGSHAYGTNVEGSDIDIRGAAGSPDILGFNHFEQVIDNKTDTVIRDKEHEELLAIRNGRYMREDGTYEPAFFDMVDSFEVRFQKAVKESSLPAKPDMQKIEELLVAINKSYLSRTM